jgi:arabinan endo-1,5-alpha-L-arabinosidase
LSLTDPTLFRWQDTYWLFSTGPGLAVHSSKDLSTFRKENQVFAQNPGWISQTLPQVTDLWSPDVHAWNGTIHLYYSASTFSTDKSCIGHATTTAMGQPFVDQGSLICSNLTGSTENYNTIDPTVLTSPTDDPWMVFGSWDSGIKLIALDRDGKRRDDTIYSVAARTSSNLPIQAASLYRWRDYYYLFVSYENSPNHSLRMGRSKQVTGPYLDRDGQSMLTGGGTVLLSSNDQFKGAGSNMIFDDQNQRLNVYHAYDTNGTAQLRIGQLFFDNGGWPVTAGP